MKRNLSSTGRLTLMVTGLSLAACSGDDTETPDPMDAGLASPDAEADAGVSDMDSGLSPDMGIPPEPDAGFAEDASPPPMDAGSPDASPDPCSMTLGVSCSEFDEAYLKASNTDRFDLFGGAVALSADGNTMVVGAVLEASAAQGIDGNQSNNSAPVSGAVYVFTRVGTTWTQEAYLKASNTDRNSEFGARVALSADGNTLAVGAFGEDSDGRGVNGSQQFSVESANTGAVYVFVRANAQWSQQAFIKASNPQVGYQFGIGVALSADGQTLAVGSENEGSNAQGIDGDQSDTSAPASGAVYVFTRTGVEWAQQAYIKASNAGVGDRFGSALALGADGNTLAVAAPDEDSGALSINGDQSDNSVSGSGAVYFFTRSGANWAQEAYIKASTAGQGGEFGSGFGSSVAMNADGTTLVVGATSYDGTPVVVPQDEQFNDGAAYVFVRSGTTWTEQALLRASNAGEGDTFGRAAALSSDGATLVISADAEDGSGLGLVGRPEDDSAESSGAVYLFTRATSRWTQVAYIKASNTEATDTLGTGLALSDDGRTLAMGAPREASGARGINGDQADNSRPQSGAVYVRRVAP